MKLKQREMELVTQDFVIIHEIYGKGIFLLSMVSAINVLFMLESGQRMEMNSEIFSSFSSEKNQYTTNKHLLSVYYI